MSDPKFRDKGWLNRKNMASSCGVSVQAFDAWGVKPVAVVGREKFFKTRDVMINRLQFEQSKLGIESTPLEKFLLLEQSEGC